MARLQPNYIPPEALSEDAIAHDHIKVTLKQGPELTGSRLVAALKRLVEIGGRVEKEVER